VVDSAVWSTVSSAVNNELRNNINNKGVL
jgi:hypothetical protein